MLLSFAEMVLNFNISLAQDTVVMYVRNTHVLTFYLNFSALGSGFRPKTRLR